MLSTIIGFSFGGFKRLANARYKEALSKE